MDGCVVITKITPDPPNSILYEFRVPKPDVSTGNIDFLRFIIPKGYVCLDGTSLTVVEVNRLSRSFSIMLVKYTQDKVIMTQKKVGDTVNMECDEMGKYVEKIVHGMLLCNKYVSEDEETERKLEECNENPLERMIDRMINEKLEEKMKQK